MNEVYKNTHPFMDVLKMARSEAVGRWDEAALHRAYKWAQYFEEVYCKLKTKPFLAQKLDQYLLNFGKSTSAYLGNLHPSFEMLQHSKEILRQCLLQNPHLSQKLTEVVLQLYGVKIGETDPGNNVDTLLKDIVTFGQSKAAVQILSKMTDCLTTHLKEAPAMDLARDASVQAMDSSSSGLDTCEDLQLGSREASVFAASQCLFQHLQHHLQHGGTEDKDMLCKKLVEFASQDCGLYTVVMLLSQTPHNHHQLDTRSDEVTQFVLEWVVECVSHADRCVVLLGLPPCLLARVSSMYISFFKVYLSQLINWGNNMVWQLVASSEDEPGITVIGWRHDDRSKESTLNFDKLVRHIKALISGAAYVAELTTKALESLAAEKTMDGNNRLTLNGANIWQEILALLNTK